MPLWSSGWVPYSVTLVIYRGLHCAPPTDLLIIKLMVILFIYHWFVFFVYSWNRTTQNYWTCSLLYSVECLCSGTETSSLISEVSVFRNSGYGSSSFLLCIWRIHISNISAGLCMIGYVNMNLFMTPNVIPPNQNESKSLIAPDLLLLHETLH